MKKNFYSKFKSHLKASLFLTKLFFYRRYKRFHLSFFWTFFPTFSVLIATIISSKQLDLKSFGFEIHYTLWVLPAFVIFRSITESIDVGQKLIQISFLAQRSLNIKNYQIFLACIFASLIILVFDILLAAGIILFFLEDINIINISIYFFFIIYGILIVTVFSIFFGTASMLIYDLRFISKFLRGFILFCTPIFYIMPKSGIIEFINKFNPFTYLISSSREVIIYGMTENVIFTLASFIFLLILAIIFLNKFKLWIQIINSTLVKGAVGQTYAWYVVFRTKTKNDKR